MKSIVIIPAAGAGSRMNTDKPKQFTEINGIPILIHSIQLFDNIDQVESIILSVHNQ